MKYGRPVKKWYGHACATKIVTNDDLAKLMDTSDEWIQQRSGIKERHVDDDVTPTDIAEKVALAALEKAGLKGSDIDMLVVATLSPEHFFPGICILQERLNGNGACFRRAVPVHWLYMPSTWDSCLSRVVNTAELWWWAKIHSRGVEFATRGRDVAVLFGDGAGGDFGTGRVRGPRFFVDSSACRREVCG